MTTTYRSRADEAQARAVRACNAAIEALQALEEVPRSHEERREEDGALVADAHAYARVLKNFVDQLASQTAPDDEAADEPALVDDPHAATVARWARLLALGDAFREALLPMRHGPDADLQAVMTDWYRSPSREHVPGYVADICDECRAMQVNVDHWWRAIDGILPPPIRDAAGLLVVVASADE